jgi:hypothetical protein
MGILNITANYKNYLSTVVLKQSIEKFKKTFNNRIRGINGGEYAKVIECCY